MPKIDFLFFSLDFQHIFLDFHFTIFFLFLDQYYEKNIFLFFELVNINLNKA